MDFIIGHDVMKLEKREAIERIQEIIPFIPSAVVDSIYSMILRVMDSLAKEERTCGDFLLVVKYYRVPGIDGYQVKIGSRKIDFKWMETCHAQ